MSTGHGSEVGIADDMDTKSDPVKGQAQSIIGSVDEGDVLQTDYTEQENKLLVRKLDWHVSPLGPRNRADTLLTT